jgi:hypothetical protein
MEIGTMVLFVEDNAPTLSWKLDRVIKLHPGDDGVTRVVTSNAQHADYVSSHWKNKCAVMCVCVCVQKSNEKADKYRVIINVCSQRAHENK